MPRLDRIALDATTSASDIDAVIDRVVDEQRAGPAQRRGIVVPPAFAKRAVERVRTGGGNIRVASVVAYPLGLAKPTIKAIEATNLAKDGVDAVEVSPLLANLRQLDPDGGYDALRRELLEIVRGGRAAKPTLSVHLYFDLDTYTPSDAAWPAILSAIRQGACDGIVLASQDDERLRAAIAVTAGEADLERGIRSADQRATAWSGIDAIGLRFSPI